MEKNKRLNPRNILNKPIYNSILSIISTYKNRKVKFNHLKYALVNKDYNRIKKKMDDFYIHSVDDELIKSITIEYEKGKLDKKIFTTLMNYLKQSYLEKIKEKLGSESSLRDKLYELIKLGLIEKKSDSIGYPYYKLTDFGNRLYYRWLVHYTIDNYITDDEINDFQSVLIKYIFKKKKV